MDWSLALASQGIEVVIDHQPDGLGWVLIVEPEQEAAALATIRQYRLENRGWALRQRLRDLGFSFHWGVLLWAWALITLHWLADASGEGLERVGSMSHLVRVSGEWWRLFTATTLHADAGHLAANVSTGIAALGLAMGRYGAGWTLLATLLAGALGNAAGLLFHASPYRGLGASGVVMGALGLLAVQSLGVWRNPRAAWRSLLAGVVAGGLLFVMFGLSPASDVVAHAGGFAGGLLLGLGLNFLPERLGPRTTAGRWAGAAAILLVAACWSLALWHQ
jgi:membrane associated rhomboid family serine protease